MTYLETATQIIKDSIKSAIFIDENAREVYSDRNELPEYEEELSFELYNSFKTKGISLTIQKFENGQEEDYEVLEYLFCGRDLVLLDWKLEGKYGEERSLKFLKEIIKRKNIHFCVIYTSEPNIDNIYANILTYFSGKNIEDFEEIKVNFEAYEEQLNALFPKFDLFDLSINGRMIKDISGIGPEFKQELEKLDKNILNAFKNLKLAFGKYHKSNERILYTLDSFTNKTVVINNTIVSIVNKLTDDYKSDADGIIEKFSSNIISSPFSYNKLLGLELQNKFVNNGAFIDSEFFNVTKETLAFHRNQIMDSFKSDHSFRELLKNVFIEQASLKLESSQLKILSQDLFDEFKVSTLPKNIELASMNVFYNSVSLPTENKKLDFGDVFISEEEEYYLCVTALCDCLRPSKTDYIFYFTKGIKMPIESALDLGDSAFISYISKNKAVVWSNVDAVKGKSVEERLRELDQFRYKPIYIKPITYLVLNPQIDKGKIQLARIFQYRQNEGDLEFMNLEYVTTIKPTYAQRIANHAFTHPVRIGIDFVKKTN